MKLALQLALWTPALLVWTTPVRDEYKETMDADGLTKNLQSDHGLVDDDARTDQSETFQKAIDDLAAQGGGRWIVPKGTYRLAGVKLRPNIHLLIEKDTVLKPDWPQGTKTVVFHLDADRPASNGNGNLLLNLPLHPDGSLDGDEIAFPDATGQWMKVNGEGIYGMRPWVIFGEGPAEGGGGHFNESATHDTSRDFRDTAKGESQVYAPRS